VKRLLLTALALALVVGACGDGDVGDDDTSTIPGDAPASTDAITTAGPSAAPPVGETWNLDGIEIELDQPALWRAVGSPPEGADAAAYAPSDNNVVAERLLVKTMPLDSSASLAERVEAATDDLEANYDVALFLEATDTVVGVDRVPAQQIRFTWESGIEAGVGWRWIFPADTQLIYITFLADLSEPSLYLLEVQDALLSAVIGG
jgi:hypothetical protein